MTRTASAPFDLDHVPFATPDVVAAGRHLEMLGFATTSIGVCRWSFAGRAHEARSVSVVFPDAYLDLIEVGDAGRAESLRSSLPTRPGMSPSGVVLTAGSLESARAALEEGEIPTRAPYSIVRDLPGATPERIRYEIFACAPAELPLAVIQDSAPQALRRPEWLAHPNTARGIGRVHLLSTQARAAAVVTGTLGSTAPLAIHMGDPEDPYLARVAELRARPAVPGVLGVEIDVTSLDEAASCLQRSALRHQRSPGRIEIDPTDAIGCGLVYRSGA